MLSDIGGIINPDIEKIAKFLKQENILLLEDAAHSFGARLNKKFSGTFGDAFRRWHGTQPHEEKSIACHDRENSLYQSRHS